MWNSTLLDDLGYVQQSPDEAEVLFTLLAERYERRSMMVTSNLVFSQWDRIFRDPDGHGRGDRPPGAPRRGARVRRAELSNGSVAPNVAAIATARASRPAAGAAVAAASPTCELLSVSGPEAITASTETFTAHIFSRARVATTSPSLRKPRARLPHSVNVPKRTFTPFGLLRLQNPAATPSERCVVERAAVRTGKNS